VLVAVLADILMHTLQLCLQLILTLLVRQVQPEQAGQTDLLAVLVVLVLFTSWSFMYEIRNH